MSTEDAMRYILLILVAAAACGESPTGYEPPPFPDVSGSYAGEYLPTPATSNISLVDHEVRLTLSQADSVLTGRWEFDVTFYVAGQDRTETPDPYSRTFTGDAIGRIWRDGRIELTTMQMCDRESLWIRRVDDAPDMFFSGPPTLFVAVADECPTFKSVSSNLQLWPGA